MITSFLIAEGGGRACNFLFWPSESFLCTINSTSGRVLASLRVASFPGAEEGGEERAPAASPGTHCLRMRLIATE